MKNFEFHLPTRIIFGKDAEEQVGRLAADYGKKIMILYGSDRIRRNGLLDRIAGLLEASGAHCIFFGGIRENPDLETAERAAALARREQAELLLAIGGGSVIDTAKAAGIGACVKEEIWDFYSGALTPVQALPIGVVLTMAATASEANCTSVLSNPKTKEKRMLASPLTYPRFALMNPELTCSVPKRQTAIGSLDIFAHAFERYFDLGRKNTLRDSLCVAIMKTVAQILPGVLEKPSDYEGRSQLMWASTMAHSDIIGDGGVFACHEMSHVVTEEYGLAHGTALAILMPVWCKYMLVRHPEVFAAFAKEVWHAGEGMDDMQAAQEGILKFQQFINGIGLPASFGEAGIRNPDAAYLARRVLDGRDVIGEAFEPVGYREAASIFAMCRG